MKKKKMHFLVTNITRTRLTTPVPTRLSILILPTSKYLTTSYPIIIFIKIKTQKKEREKIRTTKDEKKKTSTYFARNLQYYFASPRNVWNRSWCKAGEGDTGWTIYGAYPYLLPAGKVLQLFGPSSSLYFQRRITYVLNSIIMIPIDWLVKILVSFLW